MRLMKVTLTGFRRFEEASVNLDDPVIAIVGPNEAGKTSFLTALTCLEHDEPLEASDLTDFRARPGDEPAVTALYLLDPDEAAHAVQAGATGAPRWMVRVKHVGGKVVTRFEPPLERDLSRRQQAVAAVRAAFDDPTYETALSEQLTLTERQPNKQRKKVAKPIKTLLVDLVKALERDDPQLHRDDRGALGAAAGGIRSKLDDADPRGLADLLDEVADDEKAAPAHRLAELLEPTRPRFLMFTPQDRDLRSEYETSALGRAQPALGNFLALGGSSLEELHHVMTMDEPGHRVGLADRVSDRLRAVVVNAWGQADTYPKLVLETGRVHVHVPTPSPRGSSLFGERSEGFRAFVTMLAFLHSQHVGAPTILLLDEAEQHLHYDAQADLMTVLHKQQLVEKIVYTTHSAGCLPNDLGAVRAVRSLRHGDRAASRSEILNSFWADGNSAGFSSLLLLMGASALAFSPMRRTLLVMAEGPADFLLLPRMFAEVAEQDRLPFQVAPGLANVPYDHDTVKGLELEAAQVCYLVDGDVGGEDILAKLRARGVPDDRLIRLPTGATLEDLVNPALLARAVNEDLHRSGRNESPDGVVCPADFGSTGRWGVVTAACEDAKTVPPSKTVVARLVLQQHQQHRAEGEDLQLIDSAWRADVNRLHQLVLNALEPLNNDPSGGAGPA